MPSGIETLGSALEGYAKFLHQRDIAPVRQQPHLVRWVREFLMFALERPGCTFQQTLDGFLEHLGNEPSISPWQLRQADQAVRIYRHQFRAVEATEGAGDPGGLRPPEQVCDAGRHDEEHLLTRFREIIRRRHYARSTEESYLAWVRRFFEYRRHTGEAGQPSAADVKAFLTRWDSEYDYLSLISPGRCPSCQTMVAPGRAMPVLAAHPTVPRAPCASTITCPGGGQCSSMGPGTSAEGPLPSADITKAGNCSRAQNLRASYVRDRRMPELKPYAKTGIRHRFRFSRDGYYDTPVS